MQFEKFVVLAFVASLAGAVYAGGPEHREDREMVVVVKSDDADGEVKINLDSDNMDFDLSELQVGESRSVVDDSGQAVLITRGEQGYSFDVNGKVIEMPLLEDMGHDAVMVDGAHSSDVKVKVIKHGDGGMDAMPGTLVISEKPIDSATQDAIRATLQSAGHDAEITFIDGEKHAGGEGHVKVIKKRIEIEQD